MTGLLRAELRKVASTRLWWGMAIPVAVLAVLINLFGGFVSAGVLVTPDGTAPPRILASMAFALTLTGVFAALQAMIATAGEYRHRTITTTYLTAPGRGRVLAAKAISGAAVGAGYALVTVLLGLLAGAVGQSGAVPAGPLLGVTVVGVAVCGLWGATGAALGTVLTNLPTVVSLVLGYLLVGEGLLSLLLATRDTPAVTGLVVYLPGNAADVALYDLPARALVGPDLSGQLVAGLTGVPDPPAWWVGLLILAAWTATAAAAGWAVGGRRDVT